MTMNDNEEHSRLLREEPTYQRTTPVNPYEPPTDYGIPPIPPPPPSPMRRKWWYVVVPILMIVALISTIVIPNIGTSPKQPTHTSTNHIDPGATATAEAVWTQSALANITVTASVPTPTQILAATPTKNPNYPADDIVQALQAAELPTDNLRHFDAFGNTGMTALHAQSSADFEDQSLCGGFNCGEDTVNLNVYANAVDAATVAQQFSVWIQHPNGPYRNYPYQAGRCFMDGEPLTS